MRQVSIRLGESGTQSSGLGSELVADVAVDDLQCCTACDSALARAKGSRPAAGACADDVRTQHTIFTELRHLCICQAQACHISIIPPAAPWGGGGGLAAGYHPPSWAVQPLRCAVQRLDNVVSAASPFWHPCSRAPAMLQPRSAALSTITHLGPRSCHTLNPKPSKDESVREACRCWTPSSQDSRTSSPCSRAPALHSWSTTWARCPCWSCTWWHVQLCFSWQPDRCPPPPPPLPRMQPARADQRLPVAVPKPSWSAVDGGQGRAMSSAGKACARSQACCACA